MINFEGDKNPETNISPVPEEPDQFGQIDGVPAGITPFGIGNSTGDVEYEDIGPKPLDQKRQPEPTDPTTPSDQ